jgi:hypothetical protein
LRRTVCRNAVVSEVVKVAGVVVVTHVKKSDDISASIQNRYVCQSIVTLEAEVG